jgi:hypothetical protein
MVYHKASLVATRDFWRLLMRDKVPMDRLGHSFKRIEEMERKAEATYRMVLDRWEVMAAVTCIQNVHPAAYTLMQSVSCSLCDASQLQQGLVKHNSMWPSQLLMPQRHT